MINVLVDMLVTGLPLVPVFLGIYTVFRVRADFDLTVEGSFVTGGAACRPRVAARLAELALPDHRPGRGRGVRPGHVRAAPAAADPVLLAGLIMSIGLFSVNLYGWHPDPQPRDGWDAVQPFLPLSYVQAAGHGRVMGGIVAVVLVAFALFLQTELGLALRATGVNARMARSQGVNDRWLTVLSLAVANRTGRARRRHDRPVPRLCRR